MPQEQQVIDPETLSTEELRQKTAEVFEQPRDDQGRFAKQDHGDELGAEQVAEKAVVDVVEEEEEPLVIVRREVDLGDGGGVQIFKGTGKTQLEAVEDLNDKLIDAQRNATRKIRELAARTRELDAAKVQNGTDQDYVFNQKYKDNPALAVREALQAERERQEKAIRDAQEATARSVAAQQAFVASHPEYVVGPANGNRMQAWVQTHGYSEFTEESLEKAFNDLSASGLLEIKSEEADEATNGKEREAERIAQTRTETAQPRGRRSSTIRGGAPPAVRTGLSESELYSMPMDELRRKTQEAFTVRQE